MVQKCWFVIINTRACKADSRKSFCEKQKPMSHGYQPQHVRPQLVNAPKCFIDPMHIFNAMLITLILRALQRLMVIQDSRPNGPPGSVPANSSLPTL